MAYVTGNRTHATSFSQRLVEIRDTAAQAFGKWRVYRNTLNELQGLSTREMADLGINPSMIRSIATEAAYGKQA